MDKKRLTLPKEIRNVIRCRNPRCITSIEQGLDHVFVLTDEEKQIYRCKYCEEKYTAKIGELTSKVADYEAMEPELETLREFKKEADKKEKTAMLDSFQEKLKGSEEYSALYEQIEKFSVGE